MKYCQGSLASGIRDGQGTMIWLDGSRYSGEWLFGVAHGLGTRYTNNLSIFFYSQDYRNISSKGG